MEYDFSQINDKEFEILSADILALGYSARIERFRPGKDQGVDGRFFTAEGGEIVIQCKHWEKSGTNALITYLKNVESKKIKKLAPSGYIFVTSCELSRKQKSSILEIFSPFIKSANDIFGREDLNDILRENSNLVRAHYKLWLPSLDLLQQFSHNDVIGRSEHLLERALEKNRLFVQTTSFLEAVKKLKESRIVILTGEPGVGKTTLAEALAVYYASNDFSVFDIVSSIVDAEKVFQRGKSQLFLFDDFLGSNYLEAIHDHADSHIVKFISRVRADDSKRFILTTRTNILNQGKRKSDAIRNSDISNQEYLISVTDINPLERAKILYNHIWHSDLPEAFIEEVYFEERYFDVIRHPNYSPRLVEFITRYANTVTPGSADYWDFVRNCLNNPAEIWRNCFCEQSDEFVRSLVKLVVFSGGVITEVGLKKAYRNIHRRLPRSLMGGGDSQFAAVTEVGVRSFLNREIDSEGCIRYKLFNPSISDFVINEFREDLGTLTEVFCSLGSIDSIDALHSLKKEGILDLRDFREIVYAILSDELVVDKGVDYRTKAIALLEYSDSEVIASLVDELKAAPQVVCELETLLQWIESYPDLLNDTEMSVIHDWSGSSEISYDSTVLIARILADRDRDVTLEGITDFMKDAFSKIASQDALEWLQEIPSGKYIYYYGPDSEEYEFNSDAFYCDAAERLDGLLSEFPDVFWDDLQMIIQDVIDSEVSPEGIPEWHSESSGDGEGFGRGGVGCVNYDNEIRDLFDRTK
jgi:energy-coupling factor transporter ATP-binding protein EcfA2